MSPAIQVPLVLRGEVIEGECPFRSSRAGVEFLTADAGAHLGALTLPPSGMSDLTGLRFREVCEYLHSLSDRLDPARNEHVRRAYEMSRQTTSLPGTVLKRIYEQIPELFQRDSVRNRAAALLPPQCLDEWVESPAAPGARVKARTRAFGARTAHIIAGNTPAIGPATILNNALARGDALIKSPSNDPMTATAVARTMIEMAPDHPLTRHVSVAYWKGGDRRIERAIYDPRRIEKIVAWGGLASIRHITSELPPGIELVTMDPKQGLAILDATALTGLTDAELRGVASRLAMDIGSMSQEACFNTRLIYLLGPAGEAQPAAMRLARLTYAALQSLPEELSGPHPAFDPELKAELDALRLVDSGHLVVGGNTNEGAIVVSPDGQPVDFAQRLSGRVANFIVGASLDVILASMGSWAQTVAVHPATLKRTLRDRLACHGAQRVVSLGGATMDPALATAQDGMELLRRMCKWVVEEDCA